MGNVRPLIDRKASDKPSIVVTLIIESILGSNILYKQTKIVITKFLEIEKPAVSSGLLRGRLSHLFRGHYKYAPYSEQSKNLAGNRGFFSIS